MKRAAVTEFILVSLAPVALGLIFIHTMPDLKAQPTTKSGGRYWACAVDNVAATLTRCTRAPDASDPGAGERIYISDIVAQSTTTTGGQFIVRYGRAVSEGGAANCATDTVTLLPGASAASVRLAAPANTVASTAMNFTTPIQVPPGKDVCVIGVATNTAVVQLIGEVRP